MAISFSKAEPMPNEIIMGRKPAQPVTEPTQELQAQAPEPKVVAEPTPIDPRIADLEKKELALAEQRRAIQAEKAALDAEKASKPAGMTAEEWKAKFLTDPSLLGISYDEMANKYLSQPTEEKQMISKLEQKIAELEAKQQQSLEQMTVAQKTAYENAVKQLGHEARQLVNNSPEDFELIAAEGAHDSVVALIEKRYKEENILMSVQDAAKQVEQELTDKALKYAGLKKVQSHLMSKGQTAPLAADAATTQTSSTPKTLSRALSGGAGTLSRLERAKLAFEGKLS